MGHTPNRLEDHWAKLEPLLTQTWPKLNEADFAYINQRFDRLVEIIRQRYGGRTEIIQEASIREQVNELLSQVEH